MKEIKISGQMRSDLGKKASKELRKSGMVPCNIYGEKKDENGLPVAMSFAAPMSELRKIVYTPHIYVINIEIDGKIYNSVMKELQFHPVTDALLHVDFYEVNEAKPITVGIPVRLEGLAKGVKAGGQMNLALRKIKVTAPFQIIPEHLTIDVTKVGIGQSIKVGSLNFEGLELAMAKETVVCSVKSTRAASASDADEEEEGAEAAEGAESAE